MNKPQPQTGPEIEEYSTTATPKAYAGSVPVFCAHDAIVPLKDLRPNPKNPNQHPPEQIKLLASIIRATGWRAPITVSKRSGLVTKGHGRLMAAQLDDLTDAPVDYQDYASEAEELADLTADNRIAELATTDNKMLAEVFADIDTGEIPFMLSGYTEDDYGNIVTALSEALHTKEPSSDPDAEIPAPAAPVTQYGDLWILGRHRVLCGDCTRPEDRALLLDGNKPEILLTDPPYRKETHPMKNTIKLDNPVQINGKSYNELTYDISEITAQAFAEADARKLSASGSKNGNAAGAAELDYGLHLYLGFAAVIAVNPEIDISDLERVRGYDVMKIMRIGRDFISGKSEEPYTPDSSDAQSETTPEPSTHQRETSESEG